VVKALDRHGQEQQHDATGLLAARFSTRWIIWTAHCSSTAPRHQARLDRPPDSKALARRPMVERLRLVFFGTAAFAVRRSTHSSPIATHRGGRRHPAGSAARPRPPGVDAPVRRGRSPPPAVLQPERLKDQAFLDSLTPGTRTWASSRPTEDLTDPSWRRRGSA